jgi:hypothetical protein
MDRIKSCLAGQEIYVLRSPLAFGIGAIRDMPYIDVRGFALVLSL